MICRSWYCVAQLALLLICKRPWPFCAVLWPIALAVLGIVVWLVK